MPPPDLQRQDQEANLSMEDSNAMTIEFLRARLLSERSVSRSARQRAKELEKKVAELEEQLKIVSLQRRKAEKATADVLAILEDNGISDFSEAYYSSSDQENPYESKMGNGSAKGENSSVNSKVRIGESEEFSGSDHDFTPAIGRSLSWKGRKDTSRSLEKYKDSMMKRRSSFASASSSPIHHQGKSCRQIRTKESRSAPDERKSDSAKVNSEENGTAVSAESFPDLSDREHKIQNGRSGIQGEQSSLQDRKAHHDLDYNGYKGDQAMEKALEHQAELIGRYEAMEKAQREWEEKFRENNSSTPDSYDPGNHSDITEEREDIKTQPCHSSGAAVSPVDSAPEVGYTESSQHQQNRSNAAPTSSPQDFAFPTGKERLKQHSILSNHHQPSNTGFNHPHSQLSSEKHSSVINSMKVGNGNSSSRGEAPGNQNEHNALVLHKTDNKLDGVLESLKQARLSLQRKMSKVPQIEGASVHNAIEPSFPSMNARERADIPVGYAGLFRLPTDFIPETKKSNILGPSSQLSLPDYYPDMDAALTTRNHFVSSPYRETRQGNSSDNLLLAGNQFATSPYRDTRPNISVSDQILAGDRFLNSPYTDTRSSLFTNDQHVMSPYGDARSRMPNHPPYSNQDFDKLSPPSRYTVPSHPDYPAPSQMPPNQGNSAPHQNGTLRSPSPDHFSFYEDHIRPNIYR